MKFSVIIKTSISVFLFLAFAFALNTSEAIAQERNRIIDKSSKTKSKKNKTKKLRPTTTITNSKNKKQLQLTNKIVVVNNKNKSLVKKTSSSKAINSVDTPTRTLAYSAITRAMMLQSIKAKIGLRYRYGSQGPRTYDCSGFVWKVFQESGIPFTRTSARYFWRSFTPVYGKDRYEFGTLVFLNRLGHVGIVADENGFYHASSSKGITYSKFKGYWSKRIVGFRRVPFPRFSSENSLDK